MRRPLRFGNLCFAVRPRILTPAVEKSLVRSVTFVRIIISSLNFLRVNVAI
jgi:hypothetical protein